MKKLLFTVLIVAISVMVLLPLPTVTHGSGKSKNSPRAEANLPKPDNAAKKDSVRSSREAVAANKSLTGEDDPVVDEQGEDPDIPSFMQG
ncbi:MAG TPA: hypothetical protein VHP99_00110, partial [Pyrinomonadaceae bacterium]|nr:hypothetical protein [Pyrinomonadaceae bacterium]